MTRRQRRRRARRSGSLPQFVALLIVGIVAVVGVFGLFVLFGDGDSSPAGEVPDPTAEDHVLGDPAAPVTVVEYADFQ